MTLRRVDPLHAKPEVEPPTVYASNAPSEWDVEALSDEITIGSALRVIKEAQQHGLTKAELTVSQPSALGPGAEHGSGQR